MDSEYENHVAIHMYYKDHNPPLIHGISKDRERQSLLNIDTGEIFESPYPQGDSVEALPNMILKVIFNEGTVKLYDTKPLLKENDVFKGLKNKTTFNKAHLSPGGYAVIWNKKIDLAIEEIWINGYE